jgi:hypothetical protein
MASNVTINWGLIKAIPLAIAILGAAYLGLNILDAISWDFVTGNVTDYIVFCPDMNANGQCKGSYSEGPVTTYIINKDQQTVISQVAGNPPIRLKDCAIVDRGNWQCKDTITGSSIAYADGENRDTGKNYKHVWRSEWHRLKSGK